MSKLEGITIREAESSDLQTFYEHQRDPEALGWQHSSVKTQRTRYLFDAHCGKILNSSQNTNRTIVAEDKSPDHIACHPRGPS